MNPTHRAWHSVVLSQAQYNRDEELEPLKENKEHIFTYKFIIISPVLEKCKVRAERPGRKAV